MIEIDVIKDKNDFIWQFIMQGHAGYSEIEGGDIVCSAVSITILNAANAIEEIVGIATEVTTKAKDGYVLLSIPESVQSEKLHDISIIMKTALIGFKSIADKYKDYVNVVEEEV